MHIEVLDVDGEWRAQPDDDLAPRPPRTPWTRRRRATVVGVLVGLLLMAAAGVAIVITGDRLRGDLDGDLRGAVETELADAAAGRAPGDSSDGRIVQVLQSSGRVAAASPGLGPTMIAVDGPLDGSAIETRVVEVDGRQASYRVTWAAVRSMPGLASTTVVVVGLPVAPTDDAILRLRAGLILAAGAAAMACGAALWGLTRTRSVDGT